MKQFATIGLILGAVVMTFDLRLGTGLFFLLGLAGGLIFCVLGGGATPERSAFFASALMSLAIIYLGGMTAAFGYLEPFLRSIFAIVGLAIFGVILHLLWRKGLITRGDFWANVAVFGACLADFFSARLIARQAGYLFLLVAVAVAAYYAAKGRFLRLYPAVVICAPFLLGVLLLPISSGLFTSRFMDIVALPVAFLIIIFVIYLAKYKDYKMPEVAKPQTSSDWGKKLWGGIKGWLPKKGEKSAIAAPVKAVEQKAAEVKGAMSKMNWWKWATSGWRGYIFWHVVVPVVILGILALIVYIFGGEDALQDFLES